jgi:LmbE family N-acetylglucosaminyl deacetylase
LCAISLFALFIFPLYAHAVELASLEPLITRSTRLMIFSPHPDDETLGAGGLIQKVLRAGGKVKVVFMTNGDGYPEGVELQDHTTHPTAWDYNKYGQIRRLEALSALTTLGMKTRNVIFLGYPDGGLTALRVKSCAHVDPYRSPFTQKFRPPAFEVVVPRADYCARDLTNEMERVILRFRPTLVATTGPLDQHPDHNSTYFFLEKALDRFGIKYPYLKPIMLTFVIHFNGWPVNQDTRSGERLDPPDGFPAHGAKWIVLNLSPREVKVKRKALLKYRSQMLLMNRFLLSFAKTDELFMQDRGPAADAAGFQMSRP